MERRQDIVLGTLFIGIGVAAAWMATSYRGAGGTYPAVLGIILTLFGAAVALKAVRAASSRERPLVEAPVKLITAVAAAALYLALVVPLGFYTASLLLMLALPIALGFRRWDFALIVAAVFISLVYLVFSALLEKPLPREALLSLFGPGG